MRFDAGRLIARALGALEHRRRTPAQSPKRGRSLARRRLPRSCDVGRALSGSRRWKWRSRRGRWLALAAWTVVPQVSDLPYAGDHLRLYRIVSRA